jgi:hypothetical protein
MLLFFYNNNQWWSYELFMALIIYFFINFDMCGTPYFSLNLSMWYIRTVKCLFISIVHDIYIYHMLVLALSVSNSHHVRLNYFSSNKQCFSLTINQHKHQHKPNFSINELGYMIRYPWNMLLICYQPAACYLVPCLWCHCAFVSMYSKTVVLSPKLVHPLEPAG